MTDGMNSKYKKTTVSPSHIGVVPPILVFDSSYCGYYNQSPLKK
jgi:hypothetical protein